MRGKIEDRFLMEAGISKEEYNELIGYKTRIRTPPPVQMQQKAKVEERRKPSKVELYAPPQLKKLIKPQSLGPQQFRSKVKEILNIEEGQVSPGISEQELFDIHKEVWDEGGVIQVSSVGKFYNISRKHISHFSQTPQMLQKIQHIRKILFSLDYTQRNSDEEKKIYQLGVVNFVSSEELVRNINNKKFGLTYFNYDLTLFQEGAQGLKFDKEIFCLDRMCEYYKNQTIDIRIQNPLDYGFKISKLKNKKYQMTLGEYKFYQDNFLDVEKMKDFKHVDMLGKGQIFFGVNFEPHDNMLNTEVKKYVNNTFLDFHADFDMMSYLDEDVPGCSLPQMYFKAPGCWTGGHQENINMSALNINHGPDYSEWYTLDLKYVESLRSELKRNYSMDLYESEGLWYEGLDWFIRKGFPVKRFLQRKDDIVVTGPGTLHWVRSFGVAIQTSWNIMPKNYEQFDASFKRHRQNKKINFNKSDTIPLKALILKYLNHERRTMHPDTLRLCTNQLSAWLDEEHNVFSFLKAKVVKRYKFYLKDLQSFCCVCKQEVLVYFLAAPKEKKKGIQCLSCFKEQSKKVVVIDTLYYKHESFDVETLINICSSPRLNRTIKQEIEALCKGEHVGEIAHCSVKNKNRNNSELAEVQAIERSYLYRDQESSYMFDMIEKMKNVQSEVVDLFQEREKKCQKIMESAPPAKPDIVEEGSQAIIIDYDEYCRMKNQLERFKERDLKVSPQLEQPCPNSPKFSQDSFKTEKRHPVNNGNQWDRKDRNRRSGGRCGSNNGDNDGYGSTNYDRRNERWKNNNNSNNNSARWRDRNIWNNDDERNKNEKWGSRNDDSKWGDNDRNNRNERRNWNNNDNNDGDRGGHRGDRGDKGNWRNRNLNRDDNNGDNGDSWRNQSRNWEDRTYDEEAQRGRSRGGGRDGRDGRNGRDEGNREQFRAGYRKFQRDQYRGNGSSRPSNNKEDDKKVDGSSRNEQVSVVCNEAPDDY